ncbi:MAG: DUF370 domain-containing protein [Clostridia bacterium]|nr:DUF370 domain-containing protein [Clostridia bacterium]
MYIHLGQETVIKSSDVIGIFDLESTTISKNSRDYLTKAEKKGEVVTVSYELPKSFIVCSDKKREQKVYISQISSLTLQRRAEFIDKSQMKGL